MPLTVTIIGAGISGLTLAIALRRFGDHNVTLLEKSHFAQDIGTALFVGPNCSGLLLRLGVDLSRIGANPCKGFVSVDGPTGEVTKKTDFRDVASKWENPWLLAHRRDLHAELKRLALEENRVRLELGVKVVDIDTKEARVRLEDGRLFEGDVIIGADGNRAVSRPCVDEQITLKRRGQCCYRWLVHKETLTADSEIAHLVTEPGKFTDILGPDRKLVQYPCRDDTVFNYGAYLPEEMESLSDDWENQGSKEKLLKGFDSFAPAIRKLMSYAGDDLKMWSMLDLDTLPRWNNDRLALIGDAAHPFLPFLGQGAAQAIEDSASIAVLLLQATNSSEVPELLALYNSIRKERVEYIREATRRNGPESDKKGLPPDFMLKMLDFCYGHDEWENTEAKLRQWREKHETVASES